MSSEISTIDERSASTGVAEADRNKAYPRMASGIVFGIVAAIAFGTNPLFAKPLYSLGFSVDSVLLLRFLPATILMGFIAKFRCRTLRVTKYELLWSVIAGIFFCLSSLTLFMSYRDIDVGVAATLLFVYPVIVAVISGVIFRETIPLRVFIALSLSIGGVALLCRSSGEARITWRGVLLSLSAAVFYSGYLIWIARSPARKMVPEKLTFYALLTCLIFYFLRLKCGLAMEGAFSARACYNIAGLSLISAALSLACASEALQRSGAMVTSVLGALEPLTAVFFGWMVFHESITAKIMTGIMLILLAVVVVACNPPQYMHPKNGKHLS